MFISGCWKFNPEENQITCNGKPVYGVHDYQRQILCKLIERNGQLTFREIAAELYPEGGERSIEYARKYSNALRKTLSKNFLHLERYLKVDSRNGTVSLLTFPMEDLRINGELYSAWNLNAYRERPLGQSQVFKTDPRSRKPSERSEHTPVTVGPWTLTPQNGNIYFNDNLIEGIAIKQYQLLRWMIEAYPNTVGLGEAAERFYGANSERTRPNTYRVYTDLHDNLRNLPDDAAGYIRARMHQGFGVHPLSEERRNATLDVRLIQNGPWGVDTSEKAIYYDGRRIPASGFRYDIFHTLIRAKKPVTLSELADQFYPQDDEKKLKRMKIVMERLNDDLRASKGIPDAVEYLLAFPQEQRGYVLNIPERHMNPANREQAGIKEIGRLTLHMNHHRAFIEVGSAQTVKVPVVLGYNQWRVLEALANAHPKRMLPRDLSDQVFGSHSDELKSAVVVLRKNLDDIIPGLGSRLVTWNRESGYALEKLWMLDDQRQQHRVAELVKRYG